MASSSKRKRVVLAIEDKLTVCDLVRKRVSYSEINNRFNIGKSTISDIVRGKEKLNKFKQSKCELGISKSVKKTKTMRGGKFDKLDQALYIWFRQMQEKESQSLAQFFWKRQTSIMTYCTPIVRNPSRQVTVFRGDSVIDLG